MRRSPSQSFLRRATFIGRALGLCALLGAALLPRHAAAAIVQPASGTVITTSSVVVRWDAEPGAIAYFLGVGTSQAAVSAAPWGDLGRQALGLKTSAQVFDIPLNGAPVYFRVMVQTASGYRMIDASFSTRVGTQDRSAALLSPLPPTALKSGATLRWDAGYGASEYMLAISSTASGLAQSPWGDLFLYRGTATSVTVPRLPDDGKPLHVRVWSRLLDTWFFRDYQFTSDLAVAARLLSPAAGATLDLSSATFSWNNGSGATDYMLGVATRADKLTAAPWADLYFYTGKATTVTTPRVLPLDGRPLYVRLWSKLNGNWLSNDYTFASAAVQPASLVAPLVGAPLAKRAQRFAWTAATGPVSEYALAIATSRSVLESASKGDIFTWSGTDTSIVVPGLPLDGRELHVRLSSKINGEWFFRDTVFSSVLSTAPTDYAQECDERGWRRYATTISGTERQLYWRAPAGTWSKGTIVLLHGGGSSYQSWCGSMPGSYNMIAFTEAAVRQGFAVIALDSTSGLLRDAWDQGCGKRFDFASAPDNIDLPFIDAVIGNFLPAVRPAGSNTRVFMTGFSNGGFMTIRASSRFDDRIAAFAAAGAGDPYGTYMYCEATLTDRPEAPGAFVDNDTRLPVGVVDACVSGAYPEERTWESSGTSRKPPFKLLHHRDDDQVNLSCMEKAAAQLVLHGYPDAGSVVLDKPEQALDQRHVWQPEFNQPILDFFSGVPAAP